MTTSKRFGWIAAGYAAAAAVALFILSVRYWFVDPAIVNSMSGMYAGGDLIGFVLIAGALGLVPTFFLLRHLAESHPRALAVVLLTFSATGPISLWLLKVLGSGSIRFHGTVNELLGLALVFLIFPRVVAIPVVLAVLALALRLARDRRARQLLACSLFVEAVPLALIILHFARSFAPR